MEILQYPDHRLRKRAKPVEHFDDQTAIIAQNMAETMYQRKGIGLAGPQVNLHRRIIVMDISEDRDELICLINPEILTAENPQAGDEGCLSIPGVYEPVIRPHDITVKARDTQGEHLEIQAQGLLAVCIQHEIDHLDGKLFIDRLSSMKRERLHKKWEKLRTQTPDPEPPKRAGKSNAEAWY